MIYIVRAGVTDMIKIGFANDVPARLRELQSGCWERLTVVREMPGDRTVERWLHGHFKAHCVRSEWFKFHPDMLTIVPPDDIASATLSGPVAEVAAKFGSVTAMARAIGKAQGTVWDWVKNGMVPSQHIMMIIHVAQQQVPPIELSPNDFFSVPA